MEKKSIFHLISSECVVHYLDRNNFRVWENEYGKPSLEKLGYTVRRWWTVDVHPNFTRGVEVEKDDKTYYFYCLRLPTS